MIFSSITFLYYFLPIMLLTYFVVPKKFRNVILVMFSLCFYGWGEPKYLICMVASILIGYLAGLGIARTKKRRWKKSFMVLGVATNLGILGYFKYADFFIENINRVTGMSIPFLRVALPVGISFYTFQILSYVVDVYRGDTKEQRNLIDLAAYITMFPQLIAGPIVRYTDLEKQLKERTYTSEKMFAGIRRFTIGLGKKVLIANQLGEFVDIFQNSTQQSVLYFWLYAVAYTLQIYFDFSGYSDMAIGLGKVLGFEFMENFNYPYISKSITEFWRRWHISLGTWFRDYVYIPLGGNRKGKRRQLFNIFVVWGLTGFWHGAEWNFLLWGLYFAILLMIEKLFLLEKLNASKVLSHVYTLLLVTLGFVVFNVNEGQGIKWYFENLFGLGGIPLVTAETVYYLKSYLPCFGIAIIGATPIGKKIGQHWKDTWLEAVLIAGLFVVVTAWLVNGSFNPFLYFRF